MRRVLITVLLGLASCGELSPTATVERGRTQMDGARALRVQQEIRYLESEMNQRHALRGEWPEDWSFTHRSALDPWGHEYEFVIEDGRAVVFSVGPDGEIDTADDVYAD